MDPRLSLLFPVVTHCLSLIAVLQHSTFAQIHEDGADVRDRIGIQEKLLYAYAYAYDSKDCVSWANLFTADGVVNLGGLMKANGRESILQACIERQKNVVGNVK